MRPSIVANWFAAEQTQALWLGWQACAAQSAERIAELESRLARVEAAAMALLESIGSDQYGIAEYVSRVEGAEHALRAALAEQPDADKEPRNG